VKSDLEQQPSTSLAICSQKLQERGRATQKTTAGDSMRPQIDFFLLKLIYVPPLNQTQFACPLWVEDGEFSLACSIPCKTINGQVDTRISSLL